MRLALFEPDQPGNVGTILRLAACLAVPVDIIMPCGFAFSDRALKRALMDYGSTVEAVRHPAWDDYAAGNRSRLVLLTTAGDVALPDVRFLAGDTLLLGSESSGVPQHVHAGVAMRVRIPQAAGTRSLNIAIAAGIALAEALRQTGGWPE